MAMIVQRRWPRASATGAIRLTTARGVTVAGSLMNLSGGGALIRISATCFAGAAVTVTVGAPVFTTPAALAARVVYVARAAAPEEHACGDELLGLRFADLTPEQRHTIQHFVARRQAELAAATPPKSSAGRRRFPRWLLGGDTLRGGRLARRMRAEIALAGRTGTPVTFIALRAAGGAFPAAWRAIAGRAGARWLREGATCALALPGERADGRDLLRALRGAAPTAAAVVLAGADLPDGSPTIRHQARLALRALRAGLAATLSPDSDGALSPLDLLIISDYDRAPLAA